MDNSLIDKVKAAGVIGAGGAGFPTHVKLDARVDTVIANGCECEPLLRVDQQVMVRHAEEIVAALELVMQQTGAGRGYIALKEKYHPAREALTAVLQTRAHHAVELYPLRNYYPAGDEHLLVNEITGRVIPEGGIPLQVQALVSNVHTLVHIQGAHQGQPVTWRYVTVTGAVKQPGTFRAPIGTLWQDLVQAAGGPTVEPHRYLSGGPMMGSVQENGSGSLDKTTSGLVVLPEDHYVIRSKCADLERSVTLARAACCQCTFCTQACPRYLLGHTIEPHRVMRAVAFGIADYALVEGALYCVGCGACTYYACPLGIDPYRLCIRMKNELLKQGMKPKAKPEGYRVREFAADRKIPVPLLISKLNLNDYDREAPLTEGMLTVGRVAIRLDQHAGAAAVPVVKAGDMVRTGSLIGEAQGRISARVHASIEGKVTKVGEKYIEIAV